MPEEVFNHHFEVAPNDLGPCYFYDDLRTAAYVLNAVLTDTRGDMPSEIQRVVEPFPPALEALLKARESGETVPEEVVSAARKELRVAPTPTATA